MQLRTTPVRYVFAQEVHFTSMRQVQLKELGRQVAGPFLHIGDVAIGVPSLVVLVGMSDGKWPFPLSW
jgi:hypothetical protein